MEVGGGAAAASSSASGASSHAGEMHFYHYNRWPNVMGNLGICAMNLYMLHNANGSLTRPVLWTNQLTGRTAPGVEVRPLDLRGLFAGTPFEPFPDRYGTSTSSNYKQRGDPRCGSQMFDALRLALLFKRGGGYFDLDILSLARAMTPRAGATYQDPAMLNNAPLFFPAGDPCLVAMMETM
eukprot:392895-Prymnesium_polylepis.1